MSREEAEKIVWDFAGLNREVTTLACYDRKPSKALSAKMESLAEQMIQALMK